MKYFLRMKTNEIINSTYIQCINSSPFFAKKEKSKKNFVKLKNGNRKLYQIAKEVLELKHCTKIA